MIDIFLNRQRHRLCNGFSRRDFLRVGALAPVGLSLANVLAAGSKSARAKSVVLVYLGGGLSHHDSFDMKPNAPDDVRGKYGQIDTVVPGLRVSDKLPLMASVMNKIAL